MMDLPTFITSTAASPLCGGSRSSFVSCSKTNRHGQKITISKSSFLSRHSFESQHSTNNYNNDNTNNLRMTFSPGLRNFRRSLITKTKSSSFNNINNSPIHNNTNEITGEQYELKSETTTATAQSYISRDAFQPLSPMSTNIRLKARQAIEYAATLASRLHHIRTHPKYRNLFKFSRMAIGFSFAIAMFFMSRSSPVSTLAGASSSNSLLATIAPPFTLQDNNLLNKFIQILPTWLTSSVKLSPELTTVTKPFTESFGVVFLSEFGDKSMFATALMAMKYNPFIVCLGALGALTVMTFIACFLGQMMHYLPAIVTHYSSIALFVFFGIQMIIQSRSLPDTPGGVGGERADAEEMVNASGAGNGGTTTVNDSSSSATLGLTTATNAASNSLNVLAKVSSLIFVAEWCDRSMLATMALAASSNTIAVIGGATLANIVCTGMAVFAASIVASKISERTVALIAGILFEVFAVFTFLEGPES